MRKVVVDSFLYSILQNAYDIIDHATKKAMRNLNLGIVGMGYWGPNYARVITQIDNVNLKWCCDINNVALSKFSRLFPQVQTTNDYRTLIDDKDLDAVIIVTPAQNHYEIAKKFLLKGTDVLVEKPLTNNLEESKHLVKISKDQKKILMVDHTFVFNGAIRKLKQLIDDGDLGKIYHIYGNYNALGPIRRDVSAMWDLPHFIYVINYLLDTTPLWVQAAGKDYLQKGMEDTVFLNMEYPKDVLFNLNCSWIDPVKVRKLVIVGERKMVVFDDMESEEKIRIYDKGVEISQDADFANLQLVVRNGDTIIPKLELKEPLKEVVLEFIESVKNRSNDFSSGTDGLNLVKVLTAAQTSLGKEGKRIFIK